MAVTIVGVTAGTSGSATATSFTPTLPAGWAAGDHALLVEGISGGTLSGTPSAGWTAPAGPTWPAQEASASRMYAWTRTLQAGDAAPTLTNSGSVTGCWFLIVVRGGTGFVQAATATASGTTLTLPTLPGVAAGSALLAAAHCRVASGTIPTDLTWAAGYTELVDQATSRATSSANLRAATAYRVAATSGSHGGEQVTSDISGSMIALMVEVAAAADPGVAPDGITVPAAVGEPAVDPTLPVAPNGVAVPVAVGVPGVSWSGDVAPSGLVVLVALGEPSVDLPQPVAPDGLTVPVEVGAPAVQQHGGTVVRPAAGTVVRPSGPLVPRPDTGVVVRP